MLDPFWYAWLLGIIARLHLFPLVLGCGSPVFLVEGNLGIVAAVAHLYNKGPRHDTLVSTVALLLSRLWFKSTYFFLYTLVDVCF
jgi:hypothetical protein